MKISINAYYNYRKGMKNEEREKKKKILKTIAGIYHSESGVMGHRMMKIALKSHGIFLSKTTVHKYMNKELGLLSICRRKKLPYRNGHKHKIFNNLLCGSFSAVAPNMWWCTDFTCIRLKNGAMCYNCTIIDLFDRSIVASHSGQSATTDLAIITLSEALQRTRCDTAKLVLHSDQGTQYTSREFTAYCRDLGITQSMSAAGTPTDNAPMERYFNTLKNEMINLYHWETFRALNIAINKFVLRYNRIRPHSYNGYETPWGKRFKLIRV